MGAVRRFHGGGGSPFTSPTGAGRGAARVEDPWRRTGPAGRLWDGADRADGADGARPLAEIQLRFENGGREAGRR